MGSMYCECMRSRTSGSASTALISRFRRPITSDGVPAGARMAIQATASTSGKPASFRVGTSGISALRVPVDTASAFRRPARTCGITATAGTQLNWTSPCSTAVIAAGDEG